MFEDDLVSSQLRHSGVLETIRIRREGYPVRMPFYIFLFRYCIHRTLNPFKTTQKNGSNPNFLIESFEDERQSCDPNTPTERLNEIWVLDSVWINKAFWYCSLFTLCGFLFLLITSAERLLMNKAKFFIR